MHFSLISQVFFFSFLIDFFFCQEGLTIPRVSEPGASDDLWICGTKLSAQDEAAVVPVLGAPQAGHRVPGRVLSLPGFQPCLSSDVLAPSRP